ncbi:hypothetical protein Vadar_019673 [Vaccinium darrowii]|uniref:Uncharacterized protein n=1 Tax=Vaccinium darrowii TaxID=229202 RepID=A0ACB7Z567_9ERIC|nr:hypothetical protein Vadar_019673 [Vaccinium darrowii]
MECHYNDLVEQQLDLYSHPYDQMTLEDWRHMIDDVWASEKHKVENGGSENKDFPEVFQKTHTNKDNEWISNICSDRHVGRDAACARRKISIRCAVDTGGDVQRGSWEKEEIHTWVQAMEKMQMERDEEKRARETEMEKLWMEREEEKRAHEAEMKKLRMEREEEKKA